MRFLAILLPHSALWQRFSGIYKMATKKNGLISGVSCGYPELSTFDTSPSLKIDGAPVSRDLLKSLGVYIDQNLSWNVHVNNLCKKIAAGIGVIKRSRAFVPFDILLYMYSSSVQPHFDYCSEIWGCCNKTLSTKLQKLQNRAARILLRASYDSNSDSHR